ncbi:hypothetical protein L7F22_046214 [Adiantum nelumboides]|nr:hypothetical protein [Adiantum nelumboides]MCO5592216.1 hypothetical protein [Adiantum nelumboides]
MEDSYSLGRLVHDFVVEMEYDRDDRLQSSLIDMYTKCGDLAGARNVFDQVEQSVVTWNAMIAGCANQGWTEKALHLFGLMQRAKFLPDTVTLTSVLRACAGLNFGDDGRIFHAFIVETLSVIPTQLGNTLLDMYAKCGNVSDAQKIFQGLPKDDAVTWTSMIGAHVSSRNGNQALQIFQRMREEGVKSNEITYANALKACCVIASLENGKLIHADAASTSLEIDGLLGGALVDMYSKCGSIDDAASVFAKLSKRSVVTWTSMFAGFAMNGHYGLAWKCLQDMQLEGFRPDNVTMVSLLSVCSQLGSTKEGYTHFKSAFEGHSSPPWVEHYTCLLDLLVQAGCPTEARSLLETMPLQSDSVGWVSFLHNCQQYGHAKLPCKFFNNVTSS